LPGQNVYERVNFAAQARLRRREAAPQNLWIGREAALAKMRLHLLGFFSSV
jgi:hypothetical protein